MTTWNDRWRFGVEFVRGWWYLHDAWGHIWGQFRDRDAALDRCAYLND